MNKQRRKRLECVTQKIDELVQELYDIQSDEQCALDSMPEGLQMSERGDQMQENIDGIDSVISDLEDIADEIYEIINT